MAAVLLDTIADAAAAAGVAATGPIILATGGWYWLDPAVALAVAAVIAYHALALIRKVIARLRAPVTESAAGVRLKTSRTPVDRRPACLRQGGPQGRGRLRASHASPAGKVESQPGAGKSVRTRAVSPAHT